MTGTGHTLSGLVSGLPLGYVVYASSGSLVASLVAAACCILGSTAPDWLEIPYSASKKNAKGEDVAITKRILKHRGLTHILSVWVLVTLWSFLYVRDGYSSFFSIDLPYLLASAIFGFSYGGVLHLLGDIPNRQRIPIFTTYDGIALGLWESGKGERFTSVMLLIFTASFFIYQDEIYGWVKGFT
ncbi:metal-dependent hydrolase [Vibrio coralliirubri]|uniref:metal-dependent hydrolase n=1 Tax=Vibrio coralliirubri TaxID=1516159 RepID=UPI002283B1CA|nr:metal-dependent hydrolase [Vibrio coralliirubri]MCY9860988.1 metal-dependent hydrolase [Vibrio coralliirubri]